MQFSVLLQQSHNKTFEYCVFLAQLIHVLNFRIFQLVSPRFKLSNNSEYVNY